MRAPGADERRDMTMKTRTASLRAGLALWVCGWMAAGCSLILDPANCADDSECNGGICQDGICVGGASGPDMDDADQLAPDDGAPDLGPDMEPPDGEPVDMADVLPDVMPDMAIPDPIAPSCTLTGDAGGDGPTAAAEVRLRARVTDPDTAAAALTVTLDGEPVALDAGAAELTRPLAEGDNRFVLVAVDPEGGRCEASLRIVADRTAPVFEVLTPPPGADIGTRIADFPVSGRVVDAHFGAGQGESALEVRLDGEPVAVDATWDGGEFSFEIPLAEGQNAVELVAVDAIGNRSAPAGFTVRLDSTAPEVVVEAPVDGQEVFTDRVEVRAQVLDDGAPLPGAGYTLRVTDAAGRLVGGGEIMGLTGPDGRLTRTVVLVRGRNTVTVTGRDIAGNARAVSLTVTRRDAMPCVTITAPAEGAFLAAAEVEVAGDACPVVDRIELRVAGQPAVEVVPAAERFSGRVVLPGPGSHRITAVAFSAAGEAQDEVVVVLDDSGPQVAVTEPLPNACTNVRDLRVCGTVADAQSGIARVTLVAGAAEVGVALPPEGGPFCQNVPVLEGAAQQVTLRAENRAGLTASANVTVRVDRTAPTACILRDGQCQNPQSRPWFGANAAGRVVLQGRVTAGTCPAVNLTVGGVAAVLDGNGNFETQRVFPEGVNQLDLVTRDLAGNEANTAFLFRVDTLRPRLAAVAPDIDYTRDPQIPLTITAADDGSGVVRILIDGEEVFAAPGGVDQGQRELQIGRVVPLIEGENAIPVEIVDLVGNRVIETITIYRDTRPPAVTITTPAADRPAALPLTVTGTIDDGADGSGPAQVTVNGVEAEIDEAAGTWRATGVPVDPAAPMISVDALDALGNRLPVPIEQAVAVRTFGSQPAAVDGLDFTGAVGWVGLLDVTNDGRLDVVALPAEAAGVAMVYTQGADGRFTGQNAAAVGLPENIAVRHAAAGDFDADGNLDLFIVGAGRTVMALGNRLGTWQLVDSPNLPNVPNPTGLIVGDFTRNGLLDVVVLAGASSRLLISNGDGTFEREPLGNFGLGALTDRARGAAIDLDGDAILDVVATGPTGTSLWIGSPLNVFTAAGLGAGFFNEAGAVVLPIDADRDGALDVLVAGAGGARFSLGDGAGGFAVDGLGLGGWPAAAVGAGRIDFDGDGRDDVLAWGGPTPSLWRGAEAGFEPVDLATIGLELGLTQTVAFGDVDGDGDEDLIAGGPSGLTLVRSNLSALDPDYAAVTISARRALAAGFGPRDAHGVQLEIDLDGDGDALPERVVPARPTAPTVVTMGPAPTVGVTVVYVDLGGAGLNLRTLPGLLPGARETVFARE